MNPSSPINDLEKVPVHILKAVRDPRHPTHCCEPILMWYKPDREPVEIPRDVQLIGTDLFGFKTMIAATDAMGVERWESVTWADKKYVRTIGFEAVCLRDLRVLVFPKLPPERP